MHKFTPEECRSGGWTRARQQAQVRRDNPTPTEAKAREAALQLEGFEMEVEYEIHHPDGRPQFFDIALSKMGTLVAAIEVDGSHGWHGYNGRDDYGKMAALDEMKARWCSQNGVQLIHLKVNGQSVSEILSYIQGELK